MNGRPRSRSFHHIAWQGIHEKEGHEDMDSRSGFEVDDQHEHYDKSPAVTRASAGSVAWQAARDAHRQADAVGHGEFYELTREWVDTFAALGGLMRAVSQQVAGYADSLPDGTRAYDDQRTDDPRELLDRAAHLLDLQAARATDVALVLNTFWSLIGRIGVEDTPTDERENVEPGAGERGEVDGAPGTGATS